MEERTQIIVAVETLLIIVAYGIAFGPARAHTDSCASRIVHAFDAMLRDFKWKSVFLFMYDNCFLGCKRRMRFACKSVACSCRTWVYIGDGGFR